MSTQPTLTLPKPAYRTLEQLSLPITALFKGASGTGKTFTACHFPNPVLFSFDNNIDGLLALPVDVRKKLRIIQCNVGSKGEKLKGELVWDNCMTQLEGVLNDPTCNTVIFDSLTTMAAALEDKLLKTDAPEANMQIQTWGEYQRFLKAFFQAVCNDGSIKKHVVVLCHENIVTEKVGDGPNAKEVFKGYELLLPTKIKGQIELFFSNVIRFTVSNSQLGASYELQPMPQQTFSAKTTLDCLKGVKSVPFSKVKDALVKELEGRIK